jgi:MFS family permease
MPEIPTATPAPPYFWRPAAAGLFLTVTSLGLFPIYGVFVNVIAEEFGSSKTSLGVGLAITLLIMSLLGPIVGPLLDRYSIKKIMLTGIIVTALALLGVAYAPTLPAMALMLIAAGVGLALYGQMPINVMLINYYAAHRARVLSIAAAGASIGSILLPPFVAWLISNFGWRGALASIALLCAVIALLSVIIGLQHYKKLDVDSPDTELQTPVDVPQTSMLTQKAFWIIALCFALSYSAVAVYSFALVPHLQNLGFSIEQAALGLSVGGGCGLIGKIIFAMMADRLKHKIVLVTVCILIIQLLAWLVLIHTDKLYMVYFSAAGLGFCGGILLPLYPLYNSLYFDRAIVGKVTGSQGLVFMPFLFAGAPMAGFSFDKTGSYEAIFWGCACAIVVAVALISMLGKPKIDNSHLVAA